MKKDVKKTRKKESEDKTPMMYDCCWYDPSCENLCCGDTCCCC